MAREFVGTEERGGLPIPPRPDVDPPPHWRLEAIAATERPRELALSSDGASVAFILDRDTSDVWTIALDAEARSAGATAPRRLTTGRRMMPYWEDTKPAWSPDGTRVAYAQDGAVWLVAVVGGPPEKLCEAGSPVWLDDERLVVSVERDRCHRLALIDVADPWPRTLAAAAGDCGHAAVAPDGARVAFVFWPHDDRNRSEVHVVDESGKVAALTGTPAMQDRGPAWSPDGTQIAFTSERPGWYEVFVVDAAPDGEARQCTNDNADFNDLAWSADGSRIAATRTRRAVTDLVEVDVATGGVTVRATGGAWGPPFYLPDGSILSTFEDSATAPQVRVIAPDGTQTTLLAPTPGAIVAAPHVVPQRVTFASFDGLEIEGLLYRPANATAGTPVAAIVNPHGGPTGADGDEWYGHAQYFVDKGYAWLLVNFRGSTSYGRDFERANHGVWGVDDTKDCLAAYDYLATLDWIDADRIAIFGGSYGSYMALCSVVDDPQHRFRCAVAKYGDCDILTSWAQSDRDGVQDLERMMGHPETARAAYRAGSPIHRIDQLNVPILVAHGELDERVNPAQSRQLVESLARLGKTYEYVTYPSEGHGFLHAGPQIDFYRRLERFLDWWLL
ncbi:MAG: putative WD40-like beta Propeller containing protein [Actinomycetia bacterium]|nr:putative WD40-like beta Propeller containing protein [Actinomycetes bacterium]